ncbi:MAG: DNA polymerase IV, partial [Acidobacteria bacterium]|nr:DNA polymerase IV [Acidobacteriota bacterium]
RIPQMEAEIRRLASQVAVGLEKRDLKGQTVTLKARYPDFTTVTRSLSLDHPTRDPEALVATALALLDRTEAGRQGVRLLGVTVSRFGEGGSVQLSLFPAR